MYQQEADNLRDALRPATMPTLAGYVTIPSAPEPEPQDDDEEPQRPAAYDYAANARRVEALGGHVWARHYFPYLFTRPSAKYQEKFWEWGWQIEPRKYYKPRVECEPRGVGKSTHGEVFVTSVVARKKRTMIGYVSLEQSKAGKHFDSIKGLLENPRLLQDYPHCRPKTQKLRSTAEQWSRNAIITESDAMIVPLSLQGSSRGWKSPIGQRFDMIVLDDIDKLGMSPNLIAKLLDLLKGEILAAGNNETVVVVLQNLIHRDSICSQILDHRADILSDREFCGPFPLLKNYEAEKIDDPDSTTGGKKWIITSGEPYDPAIDIAYSETLLNMYGMDLFERECQQNVFKVAGDKDFREWDEVYHVITYSEFRSFFLDHLIEVWNPVKDHPQIPANWNVGLGMDHGTTLGHPTAVACIARPPKISPLNDSFFAFTEIVLPKFPHNAGEEVPLVSPGRIAKALQEGLAEWNVKDEQITRRLMSHEASAAMNTMRVDLQDDLKTFFNKWHAKRGSGVPQVQRMLEIDHSLPHPFRKGLMGRPCLYFVVPDDQGRLMTGDLGKMYVAQPTDYKGFARARYEIPLYSYLNSGKNKTKDDFCFIAGTLIQTEKGNRPIESIKVGDLVCTRQGLQPVLKSELTQKEADVWRVNLTDGSCLIGTPNHPIFIQNKGFTRLDSLVGSDKIYTWQNEQEKVKWPNLTALDTTAIQTLRSGVIGHIFRLITDVVSRAFRPIMLTFGSLFTDLFHHTTPSTIRTKTPLTTTYPIWNVSPKQNIETCIANHELTEAAALSRSSTSLAPASPRHCC